MSKARDLEVRLRDATNSITDSLNGFVSLVPTLEKLQEENRALKQELHDLRTRRKEDLDQLDRLLEQLGPLVTEEGPHA